MESARRPVHLPVLLREVLEILEPVPGRIVVDCTVGLGGHAAGILERLKPSGRLIGLDLDPRNLEAARPKLETVGGDFVLRQANFAALPTVLAELGVGKVNGVLADLGLSSPHVDDPERGFSYRKPGPLDMRMDPARGEPAWRILERLTEREIADALHELGDESDSRKIARLIVKRRPVRTTGELAAIVCEARRFSPARAAGAKLHPAARTFQALRMLVNREGENLERLLAVLPEVLKPGGVAAVISFHSGEDRRVKRAFREGLRSAVYEAVSRRVVRPEVQERGRNPRSASAKLRWARRAGACGFA